MMHGPEKSDPVIVAGKPTNKSGAIRSGVGGAKDGDQGECGPAKHALDLEPGARVTGAGTHTAGGCRHTPEVGAACGKPHVRICAGGARQLASLPLNRFIAEHPRTEARLILAYVKERRS